MHRESTVRILTYGRDRALLDTRRELLLLAGYDADSSGNFEEFKRMLNGAKAPYELLVLCHTVPPDQSHEIESSAAQTNIPVYSIRSFVTPVEFLNKVHELATA